MVSNGLMRLALGLALVTICAPHGFGRPPINAVRGEVLVCTAQALRPSGQEKPSEKGAFKSQGVSGAEVVCLVSGGSGSIGKPGGLHTEGSFVYLIRFDEDVPNSELLSRANDIPGVLHAEPNMLGRLAQTVPGEYCSNTTKYQEQIDLENPCGNREYVSSPMLVAVIDSGVDTNHEDLVNTISPLSWNIIDGNGQVLDDEGHGTRVAGLIGADPNNAVGFSGVGAGADIVSYDVVDATGNLSLASVLQALDRARQDAVDVVNMSFVFQAPSQLMLDSLESLAEQAVLVASAGNEGRGDRPVYPASYPMVIGVGSTETGSDLRAAFSNFNGAEETLVDIVAPGEQLFTTIPGSVYDGLYTTGTSYSAPLVSGAAALVWSNYPSQSAAGITQHLKTSSTYLGQWAGSGKLNIQSALSTPPTPDLTVAASVVDDGTPVDVANDADGAWDHGEKINLYVTLTNYGADALDLSGTLTSTDPDVQIHSGQSTWPDLQSGANGTCISAFQIASTSSAVAHCAPFLLSLDSNSGVYSATLEIRVQIESAEVLTQHTYTSHQIWHATRTYLVTGDQTFRRGGLTIQPGTQVKIAPGVNLRIQNDTLKAVGTKMDPICFIPLNTADVPVTQPGVSGEIGPRTESVDLEDYVNVVYVSVDATPAGARDGTVESPWSSIQDAVNHLPTGTSSSAILVAEGTYTGKVTVARDGVDFFGGFDSGTWERDIVENATVFDGMYETQHLEFDENVSSRVDGFWFIKGTGEIHGSTLANPGTQTEFSNDVFAYNWSPEAQSQVLSIEDADSTIRNCLFLQNGYSGDSQGDTAGAVLFAGFDHKSTGVVTDCVFIGNRVRRWGGAIVVDTDIPEGVHISNNLFSGNEAGWWASVGQLKNVSFERNTLLDNEIPSPTGGTESMLYFSGTGTISGNLLNGNRQTSAIRFSSGSDYTVTDCVVAESPASSSFAVDCPNSSIRITHSVLAGSAVAIRAFGGDVSAANCILYENVSDIVGPVDVSYCATGSAIAGAVGLVLTDPRFAGRLFSGKFDSATFDPVSSQTTLLVETESSLPAGVQLQGKSITIHGWGATRGHSFLVASNTTNEIVVWGDVTRDGQVEMPCLWEYRDYHLRPDSPCIDAGTAGVSAGADLDGDERPMQGATALLPDMGIDEVNPLSPVNGFTWGDFQILAGANAELEWCQFRSGAGVENHSANTSVRNCLFEDNEGWGYFESASLQSSATSVIEHCTASRNGVGGMAVGLRQIPLKTSAALLNSGTGFRAPELDACRAEDNLGPGIVADWLVKSEAVHNSGIGVAVLSGATACSSIGNLSEGILVSGGDVSDSTAADNRGNGIVALGQGDVYGCVARDNGGNGIVSNGLRIRSCISEDNIGVGVTGDGSSELVSSRVSGNSGLAVSGIVGVSSCVILENGAGLEGVGFVSSSYIVANTGTGVLAGNVDRSTIYANSGDGLSSAESVTTSWVYGNGGIGLDSPQGDVLNSSIQENAGGGIRNLDAEARVNGCNLLDNGDWEYLDSEQTTPVHDKDLTGNYWGEFTTQEMETGACPDINVSRIIDAFDESDPLAGEWFADYCDYVMSPLSDAPGSVAPAFVMDVTPSTENPIGYGGVTFIVRFSEPMDTSRVPVVTFDAAFPFTRHVVRFERWQDTQVWVGDIAITDEMVDGIQTVGITNARSADGFEIPDDVYHHFAIDKGYLAAFNAYAQAIGTSRLLLTWDPNGGESFDSFEIFRSLSGRNGTFQNLADSVQSASYTDEYLRPATTYWYRVGERTLDHHSLPLSGTFSGVTEPLLPSVHVH